MSRRERSGIPPRYRSDAIELLKSLIMIESVNPAESECADGEVRMADYIASVLADMGMTVSLQGISGGRRNVIGTLKGEGGKSLMMNSHLDTVGVEGFSGNPFRPELRNGSIYGRGACDAKASIAAMITAIRWLLEEGVELRGDLLFAGVVDEEFKSTGTRKLIQRYRTDCAIVGEPTDCRIALAHKGYVWAEIDVMGRAGHGSVPESGIDAIEKGMHVMQAIFRDIRRDRRKHPLLGKATTHMSWVKGGGEWAVIPERCSFGIERRLLPGETDTLFLDRMKKILGSEMEKDPDLRASVSVVFYQRPMEVEEHSEIAEYARTAFRECYGREAETVGIPYWTDGAILVNEANIPSVIFGPGDIRSAHSAAEHVNVDNFLNSIMFYRSAAMNICGA